MKKIALLFVVCFVGFYGYAEGQVINEEVIECDGQECARRPRSSEIAGGCDVDCGDYAVGGQYCKEHPDDAKCKECIEKFEAKVGTECTQPSGRAKFAKCVKIRKERNGEQLLSCAAKQCNDKYWLWVSGGHPMGVCHSIDETIRFCKKNGQCGDGCDCVPNEIPNPNSGYGGKAYDECHCVPKQGSVPPDNSCKTRFALEEVLHPGRIKCCQWAEEDNPKKAVHWDEKTHSCKCDNESLKLNPETGECYFEGDNHPDIEGDCRYTFRGYVTCNGKRVLKYVSFKITKKMAEEWKLPACEPGKTVNVEERYQQDVAEFKKLRDEICGKPQNIFDLTYTENGGGDDVDYLSAKNRIDAFMRNAELNPNVWKNEEGKFNTARLASDLTAGVVLGTVGGIVSANVIKKKQLEKGYDALHCTVGGQKVADWGDEFTVGFRGY